MNPRDSIIATMEDPYPNLPSPAPRKLTLRPLRQPAEDSPAESRENAVAPGFSASAGGIDGSSGRAIEANGRPELREGAARIVCCRHLDFEAGHRIAQHESKCAHLHGHSYRATVCASAPALDECGRVVDFGALKKALGGWIDRHWDHGFILQASDAEAIAVLRAFQPRTGTPQKLYLMDRPPTAENLAYHLGFEVGPAVLAETLGDRSLQICEVRVEETRNCFAAAIAAEGKREQYGS